MEWKDGSFAGASVAVTERCGSEIRSSEQLKNIRQRERTPEILEIQEMRLLLPALGIRERAMLFLDMPSGLRRGELAGLKWEDFDFKKLHVSVTRSLVDQRVGPVKTETSRKLMPSTSSWLVNCSLARCDTVQEAVQLCMGHRCQPCWSQAREATRLAKHGDARLHPADGPKVGHPEEGVVAYLSTHIFLDS
jgi:site-specific recombinase XerC